LPSVTLTHVCGTNSHNWWAKGLPGVGVVQIFCDSDSLGWKSLRLRLHSPACNQLVCLYMTHSITIKVANKDALNSNTVFFLSNEWNCTLANLWPHVFKANTIAMKKVLWSCTLILNSISCFLFLITFTEQC